MTEEQFTAELPTAKIMAAPSVKRILRRHEQAIDDVLQNASLQAWKNLSRFQETCQFSTWFYQIARREALQYLRKNRRELISLDELEEEIHNPDRFYKNLVLQKAVLSGKPTPEEQILMKERNKKLVDEVLKLNPKKRADVLLWGVGERREERCKTTTKISRWKGMKILREKLDKISPSL